MKDKRTNKIKQHYDVYINEQPYKVLSCKISEEEHLLSIKTKIKGQSFPKSGRLMLSIPSKDFAQELCVSFQGMLSTPSLEHWEYTIV